MTRILFGLLALVILSPGCTALNVSRMFQQEIVADARHPVIDVMCLWEAAEGTGLDGMPCRGFRGQVLFFTAGQKSPAKVDGDIRIYVFDSNGPDGDPSKPIHQFDFPGLAWNTFLTQTNFGNAYQIFIPYTKPGTDHVDCQLRVRFIPKAGNTVHSRACMVTLAGSKNAMAQRSRSAGMKGMGIQQASHEVEVDGAEGARRPPRRLPGLAPENVDTIRIPDDVRQRSQDLQVRKLRQLAADLTAEEPEETPQPPPAVEQPTPTVRKRLNPLAAEALATPPTPESAPSAAEPAKTAARHPFLD